MIFYYKSNNDFNIQVKNLLQDLDNQLNIQIEKKKILSNCLENINKIISNNSIDPQISTKFLSLSANMNFTLESILKNISDLENLKLFLNNTTAELPSKFNYKNKKLMNIVKQYNKLAIDCKNNIYDTSMHVDRLILEYSDNFQSVINNFILNFSEMANSFQVNASNPESKNTSINHNNTLLISEIQNKVILPYTISDLENILNNNSNYHTIQDVIDNEYTIPLSEYKNPRISRFKEAFNLMRKKEKSSISDSLDLAFELSFNTLLNPAVISACKNLDELDIYLDCLSSNELDKFNFFQIKYEILPKIVRKKV